MKYKQSSKVIMVL